MTIERHSGNIASETGFIARVATAKSPRLNSNVLNVKLTPKIHSIWDPEPAALSTVKTPTKKVPELIEFEKNESSEYYQCSITVPVLFLDQNFIVVWTLKKIDGHQR